MKQKLHEVITGLSQHTHKWPKADPLMTSPQSVAKIAIFKQANCGDKERCGVKTLEIVVT